MELQKRIVMLVAGDSIAAMLAILAALSIRHRMVPSADDLLGLGTVNIVLFILIMLFLSFIAEIYNNHHELLTSEIAIRIVLSLGVACLLFALVSYARSDERHLSNLLVWAIISFGLLQFFYHLVYRLYVRFKGFARKVLIIGVGPLAEQMGAIIPASDGNYILSGYLQCADERSHVPSAAVLRESGSLYETIRRQHADKIVVSLSERRGVFPIHEVMACKLDGIEVVDAPTFYEQVTGKLFLEAMNPSWIVFSDGFKVSSLRRLVKRGMDIVCGITGLILIAPFVPLIALAIKLDSPGPVFYRQERVGVKEKPFMLYKFRTMRADAEQGTGAVWAQQNDSRVTRLGAFFRKSRIDELPQFFNILRGDMSMVGPRPERPEFVDKLKDLIPYYSERHFVRPGVTGWAQVRYPYGASVDDAVEKLRYDLYYIKNLSLWFDLMIILDTVRVVLFRKGAR